MEYNALIRQYSGESLKVLARVLVADLKDFPEDWKIRYCAQEVDRNITDIKDLCCDWKNPLQIYKPVQNGFPLSVRTIDGKSMQVIVSEMDTVAVLKLKIFQLDNSFPGAVQKLSINFNDKKTRMQDWKTLDSYGITRMSIVFLKTGHAELDWHLMHVKMTPFNEEETVDCVFHHSERFNVASGMNFWGLCPNQDCPTKNIKDNCEKAIKALSYGKVRINFKSGGDEQLLKCPHCSDNVNRENSGNLIDLDSDEAVVNSPQIALSKLCVCNANSLISIKQSGQDKVTRELVKCPSNTQVVKYELVNGTPDILEVNTVEPWRSPFSCVKCDTAITFKTHETPLPCGHYYHSWCRPFVIGRGCKVCYSQHVISGKLSNVLQQI